jgi:hypothetical protein
MSDGAFLPLPSLNLSFKKDTAFKSDQNQTSSATNNNNINITVSVANEKSSENTPVKTSGEKNNPEKSPEKTPVKDKADDKNKVESVLKSAEKEDKKELSEADERVEVFKNRLIQIQCELLLCNNVLLKNILEFSKYVIFRKEDLQELIGILVLPRESRHLYLEKIDIETKPVEMRRLCCNFEHSLYQEIVDITVNSKESFKGSENANIMEKVFKISLKRCIV